MATVNTARAFGIESRLNYPVIAGALGNTGLSSDPGIPNLALDFSVGGSLDSRITFARADAATCATYFGSDGVLRTAAANIPRFDYDPVSGLCKGLLIEESRTNGIRNNTMVGAVAGTPGVVPTNWNISSIGTLTQEIVGTGTDSGITYIDLKLSGTTSNTGISVTFEAANQIVAATAQTWTGSFYMALVGGSITNIGVLRHSINERTVAGSTVLATSGSDVKSTLTSTLQRITQTLVLSGGATVERITNSLNIVFSSGVAIDITIRIGLPQLELGAFATSVIRTTGAASTRSADVCSMTGTNFSAWWNGSAGTFAVTCDQHSATGIRPIFRCDDNTANESFTLRGNVADPEFLVVDGGVTQAQIDTGTISANTMYKVSSAYELNDIAACKDGGVIGTDTSATIPTVTQARLGSDGTNYLNGHLAKIIYYPKRLSNAQLQALSR